MLDYTVEKTSLFSSTSFEALWRIFLDMLYDPGLGIVYCILDGLDECEGSSIQILLDNCRALFSQNTAATQFKLIIVSRD